MTTTRTRRPSRLRLESLEDRDVPSSVSGTVFHDLNNNGTLDAGEPGLAGWTVYIDNNRDGILNAGDVSMLTGINGDYYFDTTAIPPFNGTLHYVGVVLETGSGGRWLNTSPTLLYARPATEPDAIRNFGALFRTHAEAGFEPIGPEQLVNVDTAGQQGNGNNVGQLDPVSVAADTNGNYVFAWRTGNPGGTDAISARIFNADGSPRTGDIIVATEDSSSSIYGVPMPRVAMADNGQFSVAWDAMSSAGTGTVKVRTYTSQGTPVTGAITVATSSSTVANDMDGIAADANGNFVVLYSQTKKSKNWGWGTPDVKVQRFTAAGIATGNAISVASLTLINGLQSVAMSNSGTFVVVYDDNNGSNSFVYAQRYSASGQKQGNRITVATDVNNPGLVWQSNVAMDGSGKFVVSWGSRSLGSNMIRLYNADGTPAGAAIAMSPGNVEHQTGLAYDDSGNVTLAWTELFQQGFVNLAEVRMCRLTASGTLMAVTLANATTQGVQATAGLAPTGSGSFVAAWQGYGPGDDAGIFAQRFGPVPAGAGGPHVATTIDTPPPIVDITGLVFDGGLHKTNRL